MEERRGRPAAPKNKKRGRSMTFRLTSQEFEMLENAAESSYMNLSQFCVDCIMRRIKRLSKEK